MKKLKKLVSLLLTLCLILGLSTTAFASESSTMTTLENNANVCVVKEVTSEGITIATNNKTTKLLTVEKYDTSGQNLLSSQVINLNTIADEMGTTETLEESRIHWGNGDLYQHTFSNYEYDLWYGSPNEWEIRKKDMTVYVDETPKNSDNLYAYADRVEDVNAAEFTIIGAVGATVAATAIAAFLTGGTAAGVAAAGGGAAITAAFANLNSCCNKAELAFNKC